MRASARFWAVLLSAVLLVAAVLPQAAAVRAVLAEQDQVDLPDAAPSPGSDVVSWSSGRLRFNNTGSDEPAAWVYTVETTFTPDADGVATGGPVAFQGRMLDPARSVFGTVAPAGSSTEVHTPAKLATLEDLAGEAGWTDACANVTHQGRIGVVSYGADGAQRPLYDMYYQVCGGSRVFTGPTRDLTEADHAFLLGHTAANTTAEDWQVDVQGNPYVLAEAPSSTEVVLRLGHHVPSTAAAYDFGLLVVFPDGFPAGHHESTVTVQSREVEA